MQPVNLRQRVKNFLAHAITEILLVCCLAKIEERQHGDRLIDLVRGNARQEKEPCGSGNDHAGCGKHDHLTATMCSRWCTWCRANALRSEVKGPSQNECEWKPDQQ